MDIVMLHFIYEPFIPLLAEGETPDVIMNHERVANHYRLTSIDLAQEISDRMKAGVLTWEEFGGTHPAWPGHLLYAGAISTLLDSTLSLPLSEYAATPHHIPEPLEANCYDAGRLVGADAATRLRGFKMDEEWKPAIEAATRNGFVDVPMLTTDNGGSFVFKFKGRAVGIFCVCGPDTPTIEYTIDGGKPRSLKTWTHWSRTLYLPWVYVLDSDLEDTEHVLKVKVPKGKGFHLRDFVVN